MKNYYSKWLFELDKKQIKQLNKDKSDKNIALNKIKEKLFN